MVATRARLAELTTKLRERGHRLTPQRLAVLKALVDSQEHPSAEQIYERVRVDFPMISLATVYKTVAVLKEMGEVLELGFSDDSNRYNGAIPHPHPHLVCVNCKSITDVDVDVGVVTGLPQQVARKTGYQIISHRFDFFGVCPRCQKEGRG
jgi:Fur family peroxide stress response transcriptional regulator